MWNRILLLVFLVGISACGNRMSKGQKAELMGYWELERAEINGRKSDRLRSLYFVFEESSMRSNLMGEEAIYPYTLKKNQIIQDSEEPIKFNIELLEKESLILSTSLQNSTFWIELSKNVTDGL